MSDTGDRAMGLLGENDPAFRAALQQWREDCARFGNAIEWRDAISFLRGWKGAREHAAAAGEETFEWGFRLDGVEVWAYAHSDGTWWPATDPRLPGVKVDTPDLDSGFSAEQLLGYLPPGAVLLRRTIFTTEGRVDEFQTPGDRQAPGSPE